MIAYFDTSAIVPLLVDEPAPDPCGRLWKAAERVLRVRLVHPEARAARADAQRHGRITRAQLTVAVAELEVLCGGIERTEVTEALAQAACELAQVHALRGYDAVHLAGGTSRTTTIWSSSPPTTHWPPRPARRGWPAEQGIRCRWGR